MAWTDPAAAADAAWATSDTLHVAAAVLGSRILRQAADAYDRAARSPYGRIPPPTPAGNQLRQAARLLSAFAYLTGDRSMAPIVLITRLAALAEAVAELRDSQQHAAQAAAARAAAEQLYAAARPAPPAQPRPAQHASTAAQLAGQSFPHARQLLDQRHQDSPSGPGRTATSTTAATTTATRPHPLTMRARTAQHIRYTAPAPERYATPGGGILRHLVSAGCRMPYRCGVSVTFTLPPVRPAWRRQLAYGHLRLMSRTVTAGQEVVREIRRSGRPPEPSRLAVQTRRTGCSVASSGFEACPPRGRAPRAGRASSGYDLPGGVPGEGCASLAFGLNLGYGRVSPSAS